MKIPPPLPRGLRLLVVEDETETVRVMIYDLMRALVDPIIDVAATVAEAERRIRVSIDQGLLYDVVILDFMLPSEAGQSPEPDHSLGYLVRDYSVQSLIVHVTAYQGDPRFRSLLRYQDVSSDVGRLCVAKEEGWRKRLIEGIHHHLIPYRLRLRFDSLFRRQRDACVRRAGARRWVPSTTDRRRSLEIAALCGEASRYWEFLSPSLRKDLERVLGHMEDEKGNHFVGVVMSEFGEATDVEKDLRL